MSYIDNNLMLKETVVYRTQLNWSIFIFPTILAAFGLLHPLFLLVGIAFGISALIAYLNSEFAITDKRIIIKTGFIQRRSFEILLSKVEGIAVDQTILGRIFNYGTITVIGTGGSHEPFRTIDSPLEFRKKAQEQISLIQDKNQ